MIFQKIAFYLKNMSLKKSLKVIIKITFGHIHAFKLSTLLLDGYPTVIKFKNIF